ncbi:hypothetical protein [Desulfovibrio sp. ZJ200]|uniref:hypothetical protein n=1 Tax=Desulfovibrio sp. ZJ200 TaxID=2709792 RepID=UPI0013ED06B6|nr:hypothetical protein [Desulfovibrio sp. ZJ200]
MREPDRDIVDRIRRSLRAQLAEAQRRRDTASAYMRERYHNLRAAGLCVRCKDEAIPGMTLCAACRLWNNQRRSGASTAPRSPYKDGRREQ